MSLHRAYLALASTVLVAGCTTVTADGEHHRGDPSLNVRDVRIEPNVPYVDGDVSCSATVPDGAQVTYSWRNETRDQPLGEGRSITLNPDRIAPGETLRCVATATSGKAWGEGQGDVTPGCGFSQLSSLGDVTLTLHIVFRPYITDDLIPGYEGQPWDWDGTIPSWVWELMDALDQILDVVNAVYPTTQTQAAAKVLGEVQEILDLYDEYGGASLFSGSVPPDPELYPYAADERDLYDIDGQAYTWTDEYEIEVTLGRYDLRSMAALFVDMQDLDLAYADNMGSYLEHDSMPLGLSTGWIADNAYCTSTYYNPTNESQESDYALLPSSILYLAVEIE